MAHVVNARYALSALVFVAVPAGLGGLWLTRRRPPQLDCEDGVTRAITLARDAWLSGARTLFVGAALVVLAMLGVHSAWRRSGRPGGATIRVGAVAAVFVLAACLTDAAFVVFAFLLLIAGYFWFLSAPLLFAAIALYLWRVPGPARGGAAVAALGWCALVLGLGGLATFVAVSGSDPICLG